MRFRVGSPLQRPSAESTDKQAADGSPEARRSRLSPPAIAVSYILPPAIALGIAVVAWEAWVRAAVHTRVHRACAIRGNYPACRRLRFLRAARRHHASRGAGRLRARRCSGIHRRDPDGALTLPGAQPVSHRHSRQGYAYRRSRAPIRNLVRLRLAAQSADSKPHNLLPRTRERHGRLARHQPRRARLLPLSARISHGDLPETATAKLAALPVRRVPHIHSRSLSSARSSASGSAATEA